MRYCQVCGKTAPTAEVTFKQNIGALVMRFTKSVHGNLCSQCVTDTFWSHTLTTLFLGWWGVISVLVTPVFLISNISQYASARSQLQSPTV